MSYRRIAKLMLVGCITVLACTNARAEIPLQPPRFELTAVDLLGNVVDVPFTLEGKFALTSENALVIKGHLRAPKDYEIKNDEVIVDSPETILQIEYKDSTGKKSETGIVVRAIYSESLHQDDSSCTDLDIATGKLEGSDRHFFSYAICEKLGYELKVTILHSKDAVLPNAEFKFPYKDFKKDESSVLAQFKIQDGAGKTSTYAIFYQPAVKKIQSWQIVPYVGASVLNYQQTSIPNVSQTSVLAEVSVSKGLLNPKWSLYAEADMGVLPISGGLNGTTVSIFEASAGAAYRILTSNPNWFFSIHGGGYYAATFVSSGLWGYSNLEGIQLYPVVTRVLGKDQASFALKYTPVVSGFQNLSLSNYVAEAELTYDLLLKNNHSLVFDFNIDQAQVSSGTSQVQQVYGRFAVGYSFEIGK